MAFPKEKAAEKSGLNGFSPLTLRKRNQPISLIFLSLVCFSQDWLPTVQLVLHADWQVLLHSPQPVKVFF